jgi:hypothetical protein
MWFGHMGKIDFADNGVCKGIIWRTDGWTGIKRDPPLIRDNHAAEDAM